ncbi:MAG: phosphate acyltransferase PlsX [Actinobacteria bacterium]|nr:phosphate acyltransferase PlsX [Actinomycetota bacterium]
MDEVVVAVDAMGGDHAPAVVLGGVRAALESDRSLRVLLVGPEEVVGSFAHDRCEPVIAGEVIGMAEHPALAVKTKKDSSIVVGCRLIKDGRAEGFFSAGSTGACMAAATLFMGRIRGIGRPAIAAVIPAAERLTVLLDVGANADVKPGMLVQFAMMGAAYSQVVLGVESPSIGLLNIGTEDTKGSQLAQEAHAMLAAGMPGFAGNVEGRDVPAGTVDVIVTDGFTGNVTLKALEGLAKVLFAEIKGALSQSLPNRLAASVVAPAIRELKAKLDPDAYGGAPLLGVDGVCIIGHGGSGPEAVANGIAVTAKAIRGRLTERIAATVGDVASPGIRQAGSLPLVPKRVH